ncbi:MAG TPA: AsmA-like C-terminal region-containing protein, partial [Lacipirellulaceae bacterium]|nr:AsmA-like C-terminal region-containing protein [Lacipirellulaceae bacterium]
IVGQVIDPKPGAAGWVEIIGQDLEVDGGMLAAIPNAQCREVIGQLHPAGRFNIAWRLDRPTPGEEPRTTLRLDLTDLRVNYERFPYPLRNIRGTISADGNHWTFSELVSGGRRSVTGSGYLRPMPQGGVELALRFVGEQVPLDADLYDALAPTGMAEPAAGAPSGVQRAWAELNPRGHIDLTADVLFHTGQARPTIAVTITPRETTQLRPAFFPYLMEQVSGRISYKDGHVELVGMRAHNDQTTITTNGAGDFWPEGHWQFELRGLTADNVTVGPELVSALPRQLGKLLDRLKPTGNFTLHNGVVGFRKSASQIAPLEAHWDVQIDCHQTDLQCGIDLKYIDGSVRLQGQSDGVRSFSAGELAIESLTFQDIQFTNVRGPMWVNESKCLLGSSATDQQQQAQRPVTGNVYDGTLAANAWVTFDNLPQYRAEVRLGGADLRRLVVERFGVERPFTGKVDADMVLGGQGYKVESLVGDGNVHIRDANLYELSLLASLLKMMRTGASDNTAFTQSDIAFRLQGKTVLLDQIDFLGDVVNLYGKGETDFDQNLNLVFSAVVGRHDYQLPFVKNFVKQANQQIMQMYVNGTLSQPAVTTEAFPGIAQMFQQLSEDVRHPIQAAEQRNEQRRRLAAEPLDATRQ